MVLIVTLVTFGTRMTQNEYLGVCKNDFPCCIIGYGKPAINEKFTISYRQFEFREPSIEFLRICVTSNNTALFPYSEREIKSCVDNTFRDLFRIDEEMSILSHPNKKAHYYPLFKINHLDKEGMVTFLVINLLNQKKRINAVLP